MNMMTEKRLIDAYTAAKDICKIGKNVKTAKAMKQAALIMIEGQPTVDAVEVVHGRWEWLGPNRQIPECMCGTCSACKVRSKYIVNIDLCPNCGAKMDGDGDG